MEFMEEAVKEAYKGIKNHEGGPFGTVIVKDGKIVGRGHNQVILNHDPTCHGEMQAIRDATKNLGTHDLSGCILYTSAYPCPMCLGASLWARIPKLFYGCNLKDTEKIGFDDDVFYSCFSFKEQNQLIEIKEDNRELCLKLFKDYQDDAKNQRYQPGISFLYFISFCTD